MSIQDIKPEDCQNSDFSEIVKTFQQLDKDLKYPNCEGKADKARIVKAFEKKFMENQRKIIDMAFEDGKDSVY
jgi:hypothetical protein